jgi:hypothetical protein
MIFERAKPKPTGVSFANLPSGANFTFDGELFLKVVNPASDRHNCVNLEDNILWWLSRECVVIPTKVKIVEVTE